MVSSFDEFNVMLQEHPFDILTIRNLIKRLCKFTIISLVTRTEMKEEGGAAGLYIKDSVECIERHDLNKIDESIEHLWVE